MIGRALPALAVLTLAVVAGLPPGEAQELPGEVREAARKEQKVLVYGSIESESMEAIQKAFEARYGIKTEYWRAASTKVMDRVLTESRAGRPAFDVVLTNATPMKILQKEGLFAGPLSPPYRVSVIGVLYNPRLVKSEDAPRTLKDLLHPRWKGKIAMPDPTRHSTTITWLANLEHILDKDAQAFREGLAAQRPMMVESFIPVAKKVIGGEAALGISYIKYVHVLGAKEGAPIDYARLNPVLGDAHHVALAARAPHPNAGKLFINFFIGPEGLRLLAAEGEFVLVKGLYPPIKDADKLQIVSIDDLGEDDVKKWRGQFKKLFFD